MAFNLRVVRYFIFLIDDGLLRCAVARCNVPSFVCNHEGDATGFVILMTEQDDRPALNNACQTLETWHRQQIDRHHWNTTTPNVDKQIVKRKGSRSSMDQLAPCHRISRRRRSANQGFAH